MNDPDAAIPPARQLHFFRIVVLSFFAMVLLRTAWLSDDGFITYRTIDNFLNGYGMRWNISERVQPYTHPLWMLILVLPHALTGEAFWSTHVVSIGISLATMALILWRTTTAASQVTAVAVSALLCNAYIDFSTSGLENPLAHLLIVTFFLYATREGRAACPGVLALFLSLFILTRHDLLLIALPPALCSVNWRAIDRRAALRVAIGLAPLALWELFSVVYYGFPVPNTAYAKLGGGVPKATSLSMGINYIVASFVYDPLCLVALATGVLAAIAGGDLRRRAFAVAAMAYIAYIVWAGGDFMAGRFLTAPFLISLLLVAERIARVPTAFGAVPWSVACAVIGLFCTPTPAISTGLDHSQKTEAFPWTNGVCSERAYYYPHTSLLRNVFDDELGRHRWVRHGREIRENGRRTVLVHGAMGFRGYFSGPDLHLIDYNALCDPLLSRVPAIYPATRSGHLRRVIPAGYKRTHEVGTNMIEDPDLAEFYDALQTVTTGPLFTVERWRAIWAMNTGAFDSLVNRRYFTYPDAVYIDQDELPEQVLRGTTWNAPEHTVMRYSGVFVNVSALPGPGYLEISLDLNDRYRIRFLDGDLAKGELVIGPSYAIRNGMEIYTVPLPAQAADSGFDQLHIVPIKGDGKFSLGHIRFPASETGVGD